jgi:hypothetical protein
LIDATTEAEDEVESIPYLVPEESDDELSLNVLYFNLTYLNPEIFVNPDQVLTQVFCNDIL